MRTLVLFAIAVLGASVAHVAHADAPPPGVRWDPGMHTTSRLPEEVHASDTLSNADGAYGRFDGFLDLGLAAGVEFDGRGAAGSALASLHYLSTAGVYVGYSDAFGGAGFGSSRLASFGIDVRPAFIPRWSNDMEGASGLLDLAVDSISLGLGGYVREPPKRAFGDARGLELSLGLGLPLAAWAEGPWLGARSIFRWDDPGGKDGEPARVTFLVTLGWHVMADR